MCFASPESKWSSKTCSLFMANCIMIVNYYTHRDCHLSHMEKLLQEPGTQKQERGEGGVRVPPWVRGRSGQFMFLNLLIIFSIVVFIMDEGPYALPLIDDLFSQITRIPFFKGLSPGLISAASELQVWPVLLLVLLRHGNSGCLELRGIQKTQFYTVGGKLLTSFPNGATFMKTIHKL